MQPRSSDDEGALGDAAGCRPARVPPLEADAAGAAAALTARDARHEALLHVASADVDGGATAALTAALHER